MTPRLLCVSGLLTLLLGCKPQPTYCVSDRFLLATSPDAGSPIDASELIHPPSRLTQVEGRTTLGYASHQFLQEELTEVREGSETFLVSRDSGLKLPLSRTHEGLRLTVTGTRCERWSQPGIACAREVPEPLYVEMRCGHKPGVFP